MAKVMYFYGCMGSRKSLDLLATAYNFEEKNIPFITLKSSLDTRDEGVIRSRAGLERKCFTITPDFNIYEYIKDYNNILKAQGDEPLKWILVDECQFLSEEQVDQLTDIADFMNITVMCYGLRTDFKTRLFPASKRLFETADTIEEIKSSCKCSRKTIVNARIDKEGNVVTEGSQIEVGGNDMYEPMCRKCWKLRVKCKESCIK